MKDKIQTIRVACMKAHPERDWMDKTCRLADVVEALLALKRVPPDYYSDLAVIFWDRKNNSLDNQSEQCINFLYEPLK